MATKTISEDMQRHIKALVFKVDAVAYQQWCIENGFSNSLNKGLLQRCAEIGYAKQNRAVFLLKEANKRITFRRAVELIKSRQNVPHGTYSKMAELYYLVDDQEEFLEMMAFLDKRSRVLDDPKNMDIITGLISHRSDWVKSWDTWDPKTYNTNKQMSGFIRHLLARYEVPSFFDNLWVGPIDGALRRKWFIFVAQGGNITKAPGFLEHYPMTKKMAHFFMEAPSSSTLDEARLYGQVKSLEGSDRLYFALKDTQLFRPVLVSPARAKENGEREEFKLSFIKFLVENPMLALDRVGPIADYVNQKKYVIMNGEAPEQPNFSMAGRTANALLEQVERWHRQLGKEKRGANLSWNHWNIKNFEYGEGEGHNRKTWRIFQLLSSKELADEGRAMKHCVASYAHSCANGQCSIWSLTMEDRTGNYRYMTIEVGKQPYKIFQTRGVFNRMPNQRESFIIHQWAAKEKISFS